MSKEQQEDYIMPSGFTVLLEGAFSSIVVKTLESKEFTVHEINTDIYVRYKRCDHCGFAACQGPGNKDDVAMIKIVRE